MRPRGSADELERRRRRAVALVAEGLSLSAVARRVGAAVSAVWNWRETVRRRGLKGLQPKPVPGRPLKLTRPQRRRLPALLLRGARAHGVRYHPAHVSRLLVEAGWSCQKPERRAVERDEAAIEQWKRCKWVAIKKKRSG